MVKKTTRKKASKKSVKKSTKKKVAKKTPSKSAKKNGDTPIYIALLILFAVLLLAIGYRIYSMPSLEETDPNAVLVTVNGQPIYQHELDFQYNLLPDQYKAILSKEEVLERIIGERLIVQSAVAAGMEPTAEELQDNYLAVLEANDVSEEEFIEGLATRNVTLDQFLEMLERQMTIDAFTEEYLDVEEPTEEELRDIYTLSKEQYATPEQVRARHILISAQREDSATRAKEIYDQVREGEDFCELEKESDDGGNDNCGEYTFPRGFMVPEFDEAAFEMKPGDVRMVQTVFGYHVIEKLEDIPAGYLEFEDVKDALVSEYISAEYVKQYNALIGNLRDDAIIVYQGEEGFEEEVDEAVEEMEQEVEELIEETSEETGTRLEIIQEEVVAEPIVDEPTIFECIADSATLYGADWNRDTRQALELFSNNGVSLDYVACDVDTDVCKSAGIQAYPTWKLNGELILGRLSLDELAKKTGCN